MSRILDNELTDSPTSSSPKKDSFFFFDEELKSEPEYDEESENDDDDEKIAIHGHDDAIASDVENSKENTDDDEDKVTCVLNRSDLSNAVRILHQGPATGSIMRKAQDFASATALKDAQIRDCRRSNTTPSIPLSQSPSASYGSMKLSRNYSLFTDMILHGPRPSSSHGTSSISSSFNNLSLQSKPSPSGSTPEDSRWRRVLNRRGRSGSYMSDDFLPSSSVNGSSLADHHHLDASMENSLSRSWATTNSNMSITRESTISTMKDYGATGGKDGSETGSHDGNSCAVHVKFGACPHPTKEEKSHMIPCGISHRGKYTFSSQEKKQISESEMQDRLREEKARADRHRLSVNNSNHHSTSGSQSTICGSRITAADLRKRSGDDIVKALRSGTLTAEDLFLSSGSFM